MKIAIISSSVRKGRLSHRVALYFKNYLTENRLADAELLDLNEYHFPIFEERLKYLTDPSPEVLEFAHAVKEADGVIIVTPEYNGGYPAALKNVVDLLTSEWKRKPIALATVSAGPFGGSQVFTSLMLSIFKQGALLVPSIYSVPSVQNAYDEQGIPVNKEATDKFAKIFLNELLWLSEAKNRMQ